MRNYQIPSRSSWYPTSLYTITYVHVQPNLPCRRIFYVLYGSVTKYSCVTACVSAKIIFLIVATTELFRIRSHLLFRWDNFFVRDMNTYHLVSIDNITQDHWYFSRVLKLPIMYHFHIINYVVVRWRPR